MEFNSYNIIGYKSYAVYLPLAGSTSTKSYNDLRPDAATFSLTIGHNNIEMQLWVFVKHMARRGLRFTVGYKHLPMIIGSVNEM